MSSSVERFLLRQAVRAQRNTTPQLILMPSSADAQRINSAPVNHRYLEEVALTAPLISPPILVDTAAIEARLLGLESAFHAQTISRLFAETRRSMVQAVAVPFGLGKLLSAADKTGGSVDTIHNARAGVYATDEAQQAYEDRGKCDKYDYHQKDPRYRETNAKATEERLAGTLQDAYTGSVLGLNESQSLDHSIAAEEIHNDPGRILAGLNGATLANEESNLNPTTKTTNSAMGQKSATDYVAWLEDTKPARDARLAELRAMEATGEPMRKDHAQELAKLTEQEAIANNPEPLLAADRKARADYEKEINSYYRSPKFAADCVATSVKAGSREAFKAAVGAVLVEAFAGIWDEVQDWYENGATEDSVATELSRRIKRVGLRVAKQWKGVLGAGAGGFISGFLANLLTVLINAFVTTAKRTARMIREGASSLITACKTVIARPEGMTLDQGVTLFTKNGYDWTKRMPTLAKELQTLPVRTAWLDGEVVVQNADGIPVFHRLQSAFNSGNTADLRIWIFDLLFINGVDLRGLPLKERRSQLCDLMSEVDLEHIRVSDTLDADPRDLLHNICVMGMEGIVCKKAGSPYTSDRNGDWIKVKCHNSREFIIVGYTRGFAGIGSLLLALHDEDGALLYAGRVRSGFDNRTLSTLLARLSLLVVPACPLPYPPKSSKTTIVWVKPQVVFEVKYAEITPNGRVRHPVFKGLRDDIPAADIGLES